MGNSNSSARCSGCGTVYQDGSQGFCPQCGSSLITVANASEYRTLRIEDMAKSDYIGVVIIALITIVTSIASIVIFNNDFSEISAVMEEMRAVLRDISSDLPAYIMDEVNKYEAIFGFYSVFGPLTIALNVAAIINAVLLILKVRFSYQAVIVLYILGILFTVIDTIFSISKGFIPNLTTTIASVAIKIALIKAFWNILRKSNYILRSRSTAASVNVRPEATNYRYAQSVPTPVGSAMESVGLPAPAETSAQPAMTAAAPVKTDPEPTKQPAVQLAKNTSVQPSAAPNDKWQCRGCGAENAGSSEFCIFCGTHKE